MRKKSKKTHFHLLNCSSQDLIDNHSPWTMFITKVLKSDRSTSFAVVDR